MGYHDHMSAVNCIFDKLLSLASTFLCVKWVKWLCVSVCMRASAVTDFSFAAAAVGSVKMY